MKVKAKGGVIDNVNWKMKCAFFDTVSISNSIEKSQKIDIKKIRNQKMNGLISELLRLSQNDLSEVVKEERLYKLLVRTCYQTPNIDLPSDHVTNHDLMETHMRLSS